ncbi:MAG TPA: dehydrogenase, partial [Halieaceae bacterium]|nr:dehydrogenase [Halieaceae bacterium]
MFQAFQPRLRRRRGASTLLAASLAAAAMPLAAGAHAATDAGQVDGAAVYERQCAACHGGAVKKAPEKTMLQLMSARVILAAMEEGIMQPQASTLSRGEREAVAEYLSGQDLAAVPADVAPRCEAGAVEPGAVRVGAWGVNSGNQRYFPPSLAGMTAADLDDLELKWAVRFPDAIRARSQPAVAHGNVYLGSQSSGVVALDARRGCLRWQFPTVAEVRTGIVADR